MSITDSNIDILSHLIKNEGFEHFGFAPLAQPPSITLYENWLEQGLHGDMQYLKDHLDLKKNPQEIKKGLHSAVLITKPYFPNTNELGSHLRVAEYAKSRDYHIVFKSELERIRKHFELNFPEEEFLCFTDASPFLERDFASQAGLGWIGKNTCLIDRTHGSLFFIGEILTSLALAPQKSEVKDFCGTCTKCIEVCPTKAIKENRVLDARICISYLNIESKTDPPLHLREKIGDWFFGCDLCQTVCPWNEKSMGKNLMRELAGERKNYDRGELIKELEFILSSSNKKLVEHYGNFPFTRARGYGLKRNALIVIANLKLNEFTTRIEEVSRQWPRLNELCKWTLERLKQS